MELNFGEVHVESQQMGKRGRGVGERKGERPSLFIFFSAAVCVGCGESETKGGATSWWRRGIDPGRWGNELMS